MRVYNHRAFEQAAAEFEKFQLTAEGKDTIKEVENELLPIVTAEELLKSEENERRAGGYSLILHFASYCPKCDQLNWHRCINLDDPRAYLKPFSHKTCCQTCKQCYLVGENLDPHLVTSWQLGCLFKIIAAIFILVIIFNAL